MLFDLFVKFYVTPENIIGLIWNIITIVGMCLIFRAWDEKWWKSLIPVYGIYLIYKHTWKEWKWLFLVQIGADMISAKCMSLAKKHITGNVIDAVRTYIETQQIALDISIGRLMIYILLFFITMVIAFLLTRITYIKICESLQIKNVLLILGTFLLPEVFLLVNYVWYIKMSDRKEEGLTA